MTVESAIPDDTTAVVTATVARAPVEIWRDLTEAERLARWYWPARLESTYAVNPVVGGTWRVRSDVIDLGSTATFLEVVPSERLVASWQWDGEHSSSEVSVVLAGADGGTIVTVTHGANPSTDARDLHRQGWTDCLTRLVEADSVSG